MMTAMQFLGGLLLLITGAELLVRGASRLAASVGISPLIIGLTVVAFGTSSPELAVSIQGALNGQPGISLGNVIGSNIFNILFILGLSAVITPLVVAQQLVRLDVPLLIAVSLLVLIFSLDGMFDRIDGVVLFSALLFYLWFLVYQSRRESAAIKAEYAQEYSNGAGAAPGRMTNLSLVVGGLLLLILGSEWLVDSAVSIAHALGVSELIIALTIIAAGTSLPEVVTSIIATLRGERDIAVGNIIGSNLFNIMGVLGLSSIVAPAGIEVSSAVVSFDIPIMIAVAFACLPIFFTGNRVDRFEGVLLLGYYLAYTLYLILAASRHDALPRFSTVMLYFVIPLTLLTLAIITLRELRARNKQASNQERS